MRRAASTDIPELFSPFLPIVHRLWQGYIPYPQRAAVCMFDLAVLLLPEHMRGSIVEITYELVPASPAVSCMSYSSNLGSFHDGSLVTV